MTNSAPLAPLVGHRGPRVSSIPPYRSSSGQEAIELAAMAGLRLDPWEGDVLDAGLGERPDGRWSSFEVGVNVPRQNGKGAILEARELAGLFLLGERLIIHSAHEFATSLEAFYRLLTLIEETPDFSRRVKRVSRSHGEEGVELKGGQRIRFRTRTSGGGRGFSCDCLILDEAMYLPEAMHGALLPTLSARPNPQVWYTGSAVDQEKMEHGVVFARLRERGIAGDDEALAYFEWSSEHDLDAMDVAAIDHESWAAANPGLGIRISAEHIAREQRSMDPRTFAVERLGIGDWPDIDGLAGAALDFGQFMACGDGDSVLGDRVYFAFDVRPDRSVSSIAVAGLRPDGLQHMEVVDRQKGTGWVVERLVGLVEKHKPIAVVCDGRSPAASLLSQLEAAGVEVDVLTAAEHAQACGVLFDAVDQKTVRHLGTPELATAVKGAAKRKLGESWAWSRQTSLVDISPLVACTLALWTSTQAELNVAANVW